MMHLKIFLINPVNHPSIKKLICVMRPKIKFGYAVKFIKI